MMVRGTIKDKYFIRYVYQWRKKVKFSLCSLSLKKKFVSFFCEMFFEDVLGSMSGKLVPLFFDIFTTVKHFSKTRFALFE